MYRELKYLSALTRLLEHSEGEWFLFLSAGEAVRLEKVTVGSTEASLSQITVSEGDAVMVLDMTCCKTWETIVHLEIEYKDWAFVF